MTTSPARPLPSPRLRRLLPGLLGALTCLAAHAATPLSDQPLYSASNVPANLMLALSVEFPTGNVAAYTDTAGYKSSSTYLGYFDPQKCYDYDSTKNYFVPVALLGTSACAKTTKAAHWSGNMLNWASMTALDEFRQALTGGYRVIDNASGLTVLQRSRRTSQGSNSNFPTKHLSASANVAPSTVVGDSTLAAASDVYIRSVNASNPPTELGSGKDKGVFIEVSNNANFTDGGGNSGKTSTVYYARVQVCVPGMLESNCNSAHATSDYPGAGKYNKPEGLIQQNANRIRVGASGYVFNNGGNHPNGLVRALLRDNGPTSYNGFGARQDNPNKEWDKDTGVFVANPDPASASASGVTNSGAINYLNQFGLQETGYENLDTLSELYWATLAYYKKVPLAASYNKGVGNLNAADLDGFPAITSPGNDPVQYTCQGNAIVTIGDSHTHCDSAIPSKGPNSSGNGACSNKDPLAPLAANGSDPGLDAQAWVNALGDLPLVEAKGSPSGTASKSMAGYLGIAAGTLGTIFEPDSTYGNAPTYGMAGMAYYAHTQNQRADLTDSDPNKKNTKITVDTYTVDVMEPGPYDGSSGNEVYNPGNLKTGQVSTSPGPNMYWLAAKYGGFDVDDQQCTANPASCATVGTTKAPTPQSFLGWHTNSSTIAGKDLRPDNYSQGNRPDLIQSGLAQIFNRVSSKTPLAASGPSVTASRVLSNATAAFNAGGATGFPLYQTKYTPGEWSGDVKGFIGTGVSGGNITEVNPPPDWHAQTQLDNVVQAKENATSSKLAWDTGRRIVTYNAKGVPFRYNQLSATQQAALNSDSALLNFLRGDRSQEGTKYHARKHVLGDIVNSEAVLVQSALSPIYTDAANPGYTSFTATVKDRSPVVYVGANDGMLHAFAADFSAPTTTNPVTGGGSELFAYVPSFVYGDATSGPVSGLAALGNLNGVTTNTYAHHFYVDQTPQVADVDFGWTGGTTPGTPEWHTLLVGGLGKGGKGIYALDVTQVPAALDTTSSSTQEASIAQKVLWEFTDSDIGYTFGRPLIVKTRKYGWVVLVTSGYNNSSGHGHLWVLNAKTGAKLATFTTDDAGTAASPSGLARATAFTRTLSDNTIEQVYAGDLLGNVWRFDLSGTGTYPDPTLLAQLQDDKNNAQPITTAPRIEVDVDSAGLGLRRWVFVGTGKFLDIGDLTDTKQQTMYALRDGTDLAPSSATSAIKRGDLIKVDDLTVGLTQTVADTDSGWYYDLKGTAGANGATERVVVDPDAAAGITQVAWATLTPTADPCSFQGTVYDADYTSGKSALLNSSGVTIGSLSTKSAVTKVQMVALPGSNNSSEVALLYGETGLSVSTAKVKQAAGGAGVSRVNWREVLD